MKIKTMLFCALTAGILAGCGANKTEQKEETNEKEKTLVLFYSQTGATRAVAEELQRLLGVDIDSIVAAESYGYDYDATIERWKKEKEDSVKVAIKPLNANLESYDRIFLGFPIWGGTYASPVATFLADNDLQGKTIVTFATYGSGGLEGATKDVKGAQPQANVVEGYGVRNARLQKAPAEISRYLVENGFIEGEVSPLPQFGETTAVTPEEEKIFNEACGNYQFPLGSPVDVASRSFDGQTEYRYGVRSKGQDGRETSSTIYVLVGPDSIPEFTRVVR